MHTLVAEIGKQLEFVFKTQSNRQNNIRLIILSILVIWIGMLVRIHHAKQLQYICSFP